MFSYKKMWKKAFKVGATATVGTSSMLGISGADPVQGIWAGLLAAVLTAVTNYFTVVILKK